MLRSLFVQMFLRAGESITLLKGPPGKVWGHSQLTRLTLAGPSMTRKRHESVMSIVMGSGPKLTHRTPAWRIWRPGCRCDPRIMQESSKTSPQRYDTACWRKELR
jgi:hypothetical protein